jgi:ketosteroid isomerase-like protein
LSSSGASHREQALSTPGLACLSLTVALNAGELDVATACFARDGCIVTPDATAVRGRPGVREVLGQLLARNSQIHVELSSILVAGKVALGHERWRIRSEGVGSAPFVQTCTPTLLICQIEEEWKLAIVAPWGVGERALQDNGDGR